MADVITVTVDGGTMTFTGPAELLERPTEEEIARRLAEHAWPSDFERQHALGLHRLGYIETRLQLEFALKTDFRGDISSFCLQRGVKLLTRPRGRGRRLR